MVLERNIACKRPFCNEDTYNVSYKHPRPLESADQLDLIGSISTNSDAPQNPRTSDGEHEDYSKCQGRSGITSESVMTDPPFHFSLFPDLFEFDNRLNAFVEPDDHPPQKLVPIGVDFQAYVPEWDPHAKKSSNLLGDGLMGDCVISTPDLKTSTNSFFKGEEKGKCNCLDVGSIKQHITEAREKLLENLGPDIFEKLGFCDMGENVADKWTEEEEEAFHEAIVSNPVSLGMKFWDQLSKTFPSRTKKDIVSYYFNVFVLRKRAEQNRFDALNIDSDNDEWQRCDNEDDSGVESSVQEKSVSYGNEGHENSSYANCKADCNEDNADIQDDSCTSFESQYERPES